MACSASKIKLPHTKYYYFEDRVLHFFGVSHINQKANFLFFYTKPVVNGSSAHLITVPTAVGLKVFFTHTGIPLPATGAIVGG